MIQLDAVSESDSLLSGDFRTGRQAERYQLDTMDSMAMTLRLTEEEQSALQRRAEADGISMQEAARRAVREYVARAEHRDRVARSADQVMTVHAEVLDRLGQ